MSSWYERDPRRLQKETELMRAFTRAQLRRSGASLIWYETIRSEAHRAFRLLVEYPDRFPYSRPRAFIASPDIGGAPHRLSDGSLCLFNDPWATDIKTTALVVRNRAVTWILAYEVWCLTGTWEAPQH